MNEITKLKTEHARYEKALKTIHDQYAVGTLAYKYADAALYPPPPVPVTVDDLLTALREKNRRDGGALHSIRFFSDESGHLYSEGQRFYAAFYSLRDALDKLNQ